MYKAKYGTNELPVTIMGFYENSRGMLMAVYSDNMGYISTDHASKFIIVNETKKRSTKSDESK